ncbi:MAG TPA: hypothetical protein PKY96_08545 [Flavobacteriales bacterium]|nr:hypothetical protein [Flavobacteriales bacterium]
MNNGNWAKTLLFTLIGFGLGWAICCLTCGRCGGGDCSGDRCGKEMSCHGGMSQCDHGGTCCSGKGSTCDKEGCDHKMGGACCKGHGKGHGDEKVNAIVAGIEKSGFQGDTTVSIDGGAVHITRSGENTTVRVEMYNEEAHEHAH